MTITRSAWRTFKGFRVTAWRLGKQMLRRGNLVSPRVIEFAIFRLDAGAGGSLHSRAPTAPMRTRLPAMRTLAALLASLAMVSRAHGV